MQFRNGTEEIFWQETLEETKFRSAVFLIKKISREILKGNIDFFERRTEPRGISSSKKRDITNKLCPLMANAKSKQYWESLPESDISIDLADKRENREYVCKD